MRRHPQVKRCTDVARRRDPHSPADDPGAFLDAEQPETAAGRHYVWIKSSTAVDNCHLDNLRRLRQRHAGVSRTGVFGDVPQSFLQNPVQADGDVAGQRRQRFISAEADVQAMLPLEIDALSLLLPPKDSGVEPPLRRSFVQ